MAYEPLLHDQNCNRQGKALPNCPLSPVLFLERAASVFADRAAVIDGDQRFIYQEFGERAHRLAGSPRSE
jgi:non-ribosomal peptide synthetase component E (peptide arylation enzyme)